MLVLHDPLTAAAVATGVSGVTSAIGSIASAQQKAAQKEARAEFAEVRAAREEVRQQREQRSIERESERALAQTRAALAAQGASPQGAQAINLVGDQAAQFARRSERSRQDSVIQQRSLRAKASNLQDAASATRTSGFISAGGTLASTGISVFGGDGDGSDDGGVNTGTRGVANSGSGTNAPGGPGGEGSIF